MHHSYMQTDSRTPIIEFFKQNKQAVQNALKAYQVMEKQVSGEDEWKIKRQNSLYEDISGLVAQDYHMPTVLLKEAEEGLEHLEKAAGAFTPSEWRAFVLGLSCRDFPIAFWGKEGFAKFRVQLEKALTVYESMEKSVSEEEMWKLTRKNPFFLKSLTGLVSTEHKRPTEILRCMLDIVSSMEQALK